MKVDTSWRKSRIAARLLIRSHTGRALSTRDRALAASLAADRAVTPRLLDQAAAVLAVKKGISYAALVATEVVSPA